MSKQHKTLSYRCLVLTFKTLFYFGSSARSHAFRAEGMFCNGAGSALCSSIQWKETNPAEDRFLFSVQLYPYQGVTFSCRGQHMNEWLCGKAGLVSRRKKRRCWKPLRRRMYHEFTTPKFACVFLKQTLMTSCILLPVCASSYPSHKTWGYCTTSWFLSSTALLCGRC